jgi:hypothetical protein
VVVACGAVVCVGDLTKFLIGDQAALFYGGESRRPLFCGDRQAEFTGLQVTAVQTALFPQNDAAIRVDQKVSVPPLALSMFVTSQ